MSGRSFRGREKGRAVITTVYEDHGIRFEYPSAWDLSVSEDGPAVNLEIEDPDGPAFLLIQVDESCPDPEIVADEVLEALRGEYPELDETPAVESIQGYPATGYDVEFFALDVTNGASIRSFQTPQRTVLVFGQWSDLGEDELPEVIRGVLRSVEELAE
jgi:hypothetical protein